MRLLTHDRTEPTNKTKAMHDVLRQIPYSIFAIGVGSAPSTENAFIASWVTQCSFEHAQIAIAVHKSSINFRLIQEAGVFTINLLSSEQVNLARKLVRPQHRVGNKLGTISHFEEVTGALLIRKAIAFLECKCVSTLDAEGDHVLVVGEVVNAEQKCDLKPLTCEDAGWNYAG